MDPDASSSDSDVKLSPLAVCAATDMSNYYVIACLKTRPPKCASAGSYLSACTSYIRTVSKETVERRICN